MCGEGLSCRYCGNPASADDIFAHKTLAMCKFCQRHLCEVCNKPHPEAKFYDGINSKWDSQKKRRCPECIICISCGVAPVPDRYEITHSRELSTLTVHVSVLHGLKRMVERSCEECLLSNPHWKVLMENPFNITYELPKEYMKVAK